MDSDMVPAPLNRIDLAPASETASKLNVPSVGEPKVTNQSWVFDLHLKDAVEAITQQEVKLAHHA